MIVGIDATVAATPPLSGVGYHIIRLVEQLERVAPARVEFRLFHANAGESAALAVQRELPASNRTRLVGVPFFPRFRAAHELHRRILLPLAIRRQRCDVFHGPAHVIPALAGIPTVVTIHDLAFFDHEVYPAKYAATLREVVTRSIAKATAVIALSEHTRRDIKRTTGRTHGVRVIYGAGNYPDEAARQPRAGDVEQLHQLGIGSRYVLYVGDFNPRKNIGYLIEAFGALHRWPGCADVQLALVGNSAGARDTLDRAIASAGLGTADVVVTGRVSDDALAMLYRNASVFALCSLVEGFTLVTLEAMSYGVPVVATNTSSIAEGTRDAATLVPLGEPEAVARALAEALGPGPRREEMRRLGLERVRQFSWESTARQTLAVYESVCRVE